MYSCIGTYIWFIRYIIDVLLRMLRSGNGPTRYIKHYGGKITGNAPKTSELNDRRNKYVDEIVFCHNELEFILLLSNIKIQLKQLNTSLSHLLYICIYIISHNNQAYCASNHILSRTHPNRYTTLLKRKYLIAYFK